MKDAFAGVFGTLTRERFVREIFNKEPFHGKGCAGLVTDAFSEADFFRVLVDCENVRAVFPGLKQARIAPNDALEMVSAGATICATGLERAHKKLGEISEALKEELEFTGHISIRGYYSPPNSGFAPHFDPRIVTNVQVSGSKAWRYGSEPVQLMPLENSPIPIPTSYEQHLERTGCNATTLHPGDLLCLPAGTLHWAEAGEDSSLAINIAFDYVNEGIFDAVGGLVRRRLRERVNLRVAPFRPLGERDVLAVLEAAELLEEIAKSLRASPDSLYS